MPEKIFKQTEKYRTLYYYLNSDQE